MCVYMSMALIYSSLVFVSYYIAFCCNLGRRLLMKELKQDTNEWEKLSVLVRDKVNISMYIRYESMYAHTPKHRRCRAFICKSICITDNMKLHICMFVATLLLLSQGSWFLMD